MLDQYLNRVVQRHPLIDCITNFVTVNDVANGLLAIGASPVMADVKEEIQEFITISDGLLINMGATAPDTITAMRLGGIAAAAKGIPVVLDPVGLGASRLRAQMAQTLLQEVPFAVIRGNISEIKALQFQSNSRTRGVDAAAEDLITDSSLPGIVDMARTLAARYNTVISISGETDVISSADTTYLIRNGHAMMPQVTGTGCVLSGVVAAFVAASPEDALHATLSACVFMGIAGEHAHRHTAATPGGGTGTFRCRLMDALSTLTPDQLLAEARYEHYRNG